MWLLLRLALSCLGAVLRYFWRKRAVDGSNSWQNEIVFRRGNLRGEVLWGLGFPRRLVFELQQERRSDRWLKALGLLVEQQTGDVNFDSRVYIRGDHPALGRSLTRDSSTRAAIHVLFNLGVRRIFSDGEHLWVERPASTATLHELLTALSTLKDSLLKISPADLAGTKDFIPWRIAAIEGLVWGVAVYAITGVTSLLHVEEMPLDVPLFLAYSALVALIMGVGCLFVIMLCMRRSSWAKFVWWETGLILGAAVPVASAVLVVDANRFLDRSELHSSEYRIVERTAMSYTKTVRGGGTVILTDHLVRVQPVITGDPPIQRFLLVSRETYEDKAASLRVAWGDGAFGFPWIASINPRPGTPRELFQI
ncbi:MAG: hypothetical protein PSV13_04630 [Lacunisphaera sp.]|nr:hypothetical protein [Lacunisphaera sp.]